jgi:hypothetical protein
MSDKLTPLIAFNDEHEQLIPIGIEPSPMDEPVVREAVTAAA